MRELVLILGMFTAGMLVQAADRPNVVFLLSDDQGWGDYGFMGHPHIKTPNLDRLAGEGLLYERGYVTAAICRPSLASIVTGLYPHQTAVRGNGPFMGEDVDHKRIRKDKKLWPLAREQSKAMTATLAHAPSMAKQLRDNGYATLQTGKWWEENSLDHGFTEGMSQGGHAGDRGLRIGRKTMQPIYDFVDKAQEAAQPFFIIRLTTRGGSTRYGDYLDYGLPAENADEALARLVNRYAAQGHKQNIFLTDPSMRAVGAGHTVIGQTAHDVLNAKTREDPGRALYHREGFGRMWQGPGKSALIIALHTALLDLAGENGPGQVRLCPSIRIDRGEDGKRRLCTPEEMQQTVASLKEAGFTAVRLELSGALDDEMKARGECAPYRYPQEVLGQIDSLVLASKKAAGTEMEVTVAANLNLSTDGMTYLALRCERNEVTLLENPMAVRHLLAQGEARKEFSQPLGIGGDYHVIEDFAQGIKHQAGTVLTPDAGRIGGVTMLARTADLAKEANLKVAPVVQGGPFSLLAVARSLSGRDEVLWVTGSYQDEWLKDDGVLKRPLQMAQGSLVTELCEMDETKFQVKRIAELKAKTRAK